MTQGMDTVLAKEVDVTAAVEAVNRFKPVDTSNISTASDTLLGRH